MTGTPVVMDYLNCILVTNWPQGKVLVSQEYMCGISGDSVLIRVCHKIVLPGAIPVTEQSAS